MNSNKNKDAIKIILMAVIFISLTFYLVISSTLTSIGVESRSCTERTAQEQTTEFISFKTNKCSLNEVAANSRVSEEAEAAEACWSGEKNVLKSV